MPWPAGLDTASGYGIFTASDEPGLLLGRAGLALKCPSCGESMFPGSTVCKACGYDRTDRVGMKRRSLNSTLVLIASAVLGVGLVVAVVAVVLRKTPNAGTTSALPAKQHADSIHRRQTGQESTGQAETPSAREVDRPAPGQALVKEYQAKIDDLLVKVSRTRKKLSDSKRMTQKSQDVLNSIESDLNATRGMVNTLAGAPNRESQNAAKAVLENRLAGIRKRFAEIEP